MEAWVRLRPLHIISTQPQAVVRVTCIPAVIIEICNPLAFIAFFNGLGGQKEKLTFGNYVLSQVVHLLGLGGIATATFATAASKWLLRLGRAFTSPMTQLSALVALRAFLQL